MKRDKKSTGVARAPEKSSKMLALSQIGAGKSAISIPQIKTKKAPFTKSYWPYRTTIWQGPCFCRGPTGLRFGKVQLLPKQLGAGCISLLAVQGTTHDFLQMSLLNLNE